MPGRPRRRVRHLTSKRQSGQKVEQIIAKLTPALRGWGNYFRTGNADPGVQQDGLLRGQESAALANTGRAASGPRSGAPYTGDQLHGMALRRLMGTVKYLAQATPRRSSLSRVPENGTHGLKGEIRNGLA